MNKRSLLKSAKLELSKINKFATREEKDKLLKNLDHLNGVKADECIYGLMTGNCYSKRATELIKKCSSKILVNGIRSITESTNRMDDTLIDKARDINSIINRFTKLELALSLYNEEIKESIIQAIK